jgi:arylsulfatase A-like enzyme
MPEPPKLPRPRRISRRAFLRTIAAGAAVCRSRRGFARGAGRRPERPNVLLIIGDDLRPQLGCFGEAQMRTPNIDRLASGGALFERCYCQQALCAPSRASLLTGLRPESAGILDLNRQVRQALPGRVTLPGHFKGQGYETVSLGKVYHHRPDDPQGWSREPFKEKGGLYASDRGRASVEENRRARPGLQWPVGDPWECAAVADAAYPDGRLADRAVNELKRLRNAPFLLCVGFAKPHLPFNAPRKYWDLYDGGAIRPAANPFPPRGAPPFALKESTELGYFRGLPADAAAIDERQARTLVHGYYACVSFLDAQVGRLLAALDDLALRERTIVVLWGDNGYKLGEHGSWSKNKLFEEDTRVPLIVSAPGAGAAGTRSPALVEAVDLFPSLCELAGVGLPGQPLEGSSFVPLLAAPERPWKRAAFSVARSGPVTGRAMRTERFRYVEWRDGQQGGVLARELYDHQTDPGENVNAAADPRHAETVGRLGDWLRSGWRGALPPGAGAAGGVG